jgi:hypothetical protein
MESISVYDSLFSKDEMDKIINIMLRNCPFHYGECDNPNTPPTGLVCDFGKIQLDERFQKLLNDFVNKIYEKNEILKNTKLYRIYLNYFAPGENPYFHIDGRGTMTCLYYLNPEHDVNEGGETQFLINNEIKGVQSKPGRLVIFDGSLKHRATSFRSHPRLTLAIKFHK